VTTPTVLVATWDDGVYAVAEATRDHELAGQSVRALAPDGRGGALAIVDRRSLRRRDPAGVWSTLLVSELDLACCVAIGDDIYVGTDDARVLRVEPGGRVEPLRSFDTVAGRDTWYAGTALIDGRIVGPPLGVRSITATLNGALLANVHVGGIPRSVDGGATWAPTIDIDSDVHEVRAHPSRPGVVMAAAAVGLCTSRDGGATWEVEQAGLHALHCSAVAFVGDDVLVSAATDPFAPQGAIYRRRVDGPGPLALVGNGLPAWTDGKADTGCIAARGRAAAVCDSGGNLYVSADAGQTWSRRDEGMPAPSSVLIV
jgi:BNR/Asp-box repeat